MSLIFRIAASAELADASGQAGYFARGGIFMKDAEMSAAHNFGLRLFERELGGIGLLFVYGFFNFAHEGADARAAILINLRAAIDFADHFFR